MTDNTIGKHANEKTGADQNGADQKNPSVLATPRDIDSNAPIRKPKPPNWVEKWTLIALVFTFFAALYAGYEATRLANGTDRLVRDAEDTAERQLRAYVGPTPASGFRFDPGPTRMHGFDVYLLNTGETPAYRIRFAGKMKVLPPTGPTINLLEQDPIVFADGEGTESSFLASHGSMQGNINMTESLQPEQLDEIFADYARRRFYVWGRAEYFDVFKKKRTFTMCISLATSIKFATIMDDPAARKSIPAAFPSYECKVGNDAD
jgi:hypothetical protein